MGSSGAAEGHREDQTSSTTQFCLDLPHVKQPGIISRPHTRRALSGGRSLLTSRRGCLIAALYPTPDVFGWQSTFSHPGVARGEVGLEVGGQ